MARKLPIIHPGEILLEEFLNPLGISQYQLAKDISVPPRRINEIVHGDRAGAGRGGDGHLRAKYRGSLQAGGHLCRQGS